MTTPPSTPITLCGFAVSNYYNKVKLSLLEKGIPFTEALAFPSQKEELLAESPMGKVPFLRTPRGVLSESQVLTEFIEDTWPEPPLYPRDSFERAQCRELVDEFLPQPKAYTKLIGERPQARKVNDDRMAAMDAYLSRAKK